MSDPSMINNLARVATGMKSENITSEIGMAILKKTLDAQKIEMDGILKMMTPVRSPDSAVGQNVDSFA